MLNVMVELRGKQEESYYAHRSKGADRFMALFKVLCYDCDKEGNPDKRPVRLYACEGEVDMVPFQGHDSPSLETVEILYEVQSCFLSEGAEVWLHERYCLTARECQLAAEKMSADYVETHGKTAPRKFRAVVKRVSLL
jgi:hypothetical protein